jgi:hypothetical protein
MYIWEIVKELKANGRADWQFRRASAMSEGYWSVNSDEIFQFDEPGEETKELAFSVDDVIGDDWRFSSVVPSTQGDA